MDLNDIKKLMAAMEQSKLKKITIKDKDGVEVHIEKEGSAPPSLPPEEKKPMQEHHEVNKQPKEIAPVGAHISSPLVGTFYSSPSPEDPPFVKVGDRIDENTVVCIVEAMKVMNEVKSGIKGTIKKILVDDAQPIEFGTKLFLIE